MEPKRIINYAVSAAIIFIGIIAIVQLFTLSGNIREARQSIDNAVHIVNESREIIKQQSVTIEKMQQLNTELYQKVHQTDSTNLLIKQSIERSLNKTNQSLVSIKKELENITIPQIH